MRILLSLVLLLLSAGQAVAATPAHMNEQVLMIKVGSGFNAVQLETTLFRPDGDGPFPLVVINHGKSAGNPALQERARFLAASREFVRRGYAVALPMRSGFSKSTGSYISGGCNFTSNGEMQARWVDGAIQWLRQQPYIDRERIVVAGQSHGGLTALALGTRAPAGVRGVINFAGGLKWDECNWQNDLLQAVQSYGGRSRLPSLWFYGDNDSHFTPALWKEMSARYTAAGGHARLVAYGSFGSDAHKLFSSSLGVPVWVPQVEKFLAALGLPHQVTVAVAESARPARSEFARLEDTSALPHVGDAGRKGYRNFLGEALPRAFAVGENGAWGYAVDGDEPVARALEYCQQHSRTTCALYAVDEEVVWRGEPKLQTARSGAQGKTERPSASASGAGNIQN